MQTISIEQLHARTEHWVRAAHKAPVVVTDGGEKIATIQPHVSIEGPRPIFTGRDWSKLPKIDGDSTELISADRDGR